MENRQFTAESPATNLMEQRASATRQQKQKQNMGPQKQNMGQQKQNMGQQNLGQQKQNMGSQKQNMGSQKQNMGPQNQKQRQQTQEKSDQPSNLLQKIKHNFILILIDYGFLFLILVANILVFMRIFQDLNTIKLDLLEIQSRGEALQKNLKPLEAAISSLGIGDTTPSPTTPPITGNTYNPAQ